VYRDGGAGERAQDDDRLRLLIGSVFDDPRDENVRIE
jgi:hypothetical protein